MEQKLSEIIRQSLKYPSGDNCQPFRFKIIAPNKIEIYILIDKAKHNLDFQNMTSMISLGCLVETLKIAASSFSLKMDTQTHFKTYNSNHPISTVEFEESTIEIDPLHDFINKRETDRRAFQGGNLTDPMLQNILLFQNDSKENSIKIHFSKELDNPLKKFIAKCETFVFTELDALWDTLSWVNFKAKNGYLVKEGLHWKNLGLKKIDAFFLSLINKYHFLIHLFIFLGMKFSIKQNALKNLNSSAGIIMFSVENFENISAFELGRVLQRSWLYLSSINYGVHPVNSSCIPYYFFKKSQTLYKPYSIHNKALQIFKNADFIYENYFQLEKNRYPFFMLRVGKSSSLPQDMTIGRLSLEDVLIS